MITEKQISPKKKKGYKCAKQKTLSWTDSRVKKTEVSKKGYVDWFLGHKKTFRYGFP